MAPTPQAQSLWICPFKAHKGKPVEDIPRGYLEWLLEQSWFCDPANGNDRAIKAIQTELAYRDRHGELDEDKGKWKGGNSITKDFGQGRYDDDDEEYEGDDRPWVHQPR